MTTLEEYLRWLKYQQGRAPSTIVKYRYHILRFIKETGIQPEHATKKDVEGLKEILIEQNCDKAWINYLLITLRGYLRWLQDEKGIPIAVRLEHIRGYGRGQGIRDRKIDYFTPKEMNEIISCAGTTFEGLRLRALLEVLYGTGMRISEALALNRNEPAPTIRVIGKGNRERTVFFTERALAWVKKYEAVRQDTHPALFVTYHREVRHWPYESAAKAITKLRQVWKNDRRLHAHTIRHTVGTLIYQRTKGDIGLAKDILGHQSIETTDRYYRGTDTGKTLNRFRKLMRYNYRIKTLQRNEFRK